MVAFAKPKKINGWEFQNYGAHHDDFRTPYLTTAVAIGSRKEELVLFLERLEVALTNYWSALGDTGDDVTKDGGLKKEDTEVEVKPKGA